MKKKILFMILLIAISVNYIHANDNQNKPILLYSNGQTFNFLKFDKSNQFQKKIYFVEPSKDKPFITVDLKKDYLINSLIIEFEYEYNSESNRQPAELLIAYINKDDSINSKSFNYKPDLSNLKSTLFSKESIYDINDEIKVIKIYAISSGDYLFKIRNYNRIIICSDHAVGAI